MQGKNSENNPGKNKVGALPFPNTKIVNLEKTRQCGTGKKQTNHGVEQKAQK